MPRPRKQPIKAGDEIARGVTVVPHHSGTGQFVGVKSQAALLTPARPRWEYRTLRSDDGQRPWWDTAGATAFAVGFDEIGADGWELVTVYPVGDAIHAPVYCAVFKREVK